MLTKIPVQAVENKFELVDIPDEVADIGDLE